MVDDWSSRLPPDLISFVPYTWMFKFLLNDFELLTLANEFNCVDKASNNPELRILISPSVASSHRWAQF